MNGTRRRQKAVASGATRLIAAAYTNCQIAQALVISPGTVANHVVRILNKLGFGSRVQIAAWAVAQGFTAGPPAAGGGG
jgi:DNA-binding NarL/FixJ family response regulator